MSYDKKDRIFEKRITDPFLAEGIGSRIFSVITTFDTRKQAASIAGVTPDSLQRYVREETEPSFKALAKLCLNKGISLDWLASGEGEKYISEKQPHHKAMDNTGSYNYLPGFRLIPKYEIEASGGGGQLIDQESENGKLAFNEEWLKSKGYSDKFMAAIHLKGDSMHPTIDDGAVLLVDRTQTDVSEEGIFAFQRDGHLYVKRLQMDFRNGLYIKSDNHAYSEQHLTDEEAQHLRIVGKVVWAGNEL